MIGPKNILKKYAIQFTQRIMEEIKVSFITKSMHNILYKLNLVPQLITKSSVKMYFQCFKNSFTYISKIIKAISNTTFKSFKRTNDWQL